MPTNWLIGVRSVLGILAGLLFYVAFLTTYRQSDWLWIAPRICVAVVVVTLFAFRDS